MHCVQVSVSELETPQPPNQSPKTKVSVSELETHGLLKPGFLLKPNPLEMIESQRVREQELTSTARDEQQPF